MVVMAGRMIGDFEGVERGREKMGILVGCTVEVGRSGAK